MASTLKETCEVEKISDGVYSAQPFFERARQGNVRPIAYGGIALGQSIYAGQCEIPETNPPYYLYSVQGTYLGPASTDIPTTYHIEELRSTRSFITRQVVGYQEVMNLKKGKKERRRILVVLMDWHIFESVSLLEYSTSTFYPWDSYSSPNSLPTQLEHLTQNLPSDLVTLYRKTFHLFGSLFDIRACLVSMGAQNVFGFKRGVKTMEDGKRVTERTNSAWVRVCEELDGDGLRNAAIGFLMDGALSFLPLTFNHLPLTAASAASSLDFSLRLFTPTNLSHWHLHEQHTESAGNGRTCSVGRLFDEKGREVGMMSQVCVLRPKEGEGLLGSKL